MTLSEKVSYLKGVAEGLSFDPQQSKEGKLIAIMMDVLEHMALTIEDNDDSIQALADQVDELDDALSGLESAVCDELDLPGEDDADRHRRHLEHARLHPLPRTSASRLGRSRRPVMPSLR